jgi:transposase
LDESSSGKSDVKDALTIANLVREGKYLDTVIEDGVFRQLRTLGKLRERIQRTYSGTKHALGAVLDDYFPELKGIFWSMDSKGLWALLERFPFPEDVLIQEDEVLEAVIGKATKKRCNVEEKVERILEAAELSVGLEKPGLADRMRVALYVEELRGLWAKRKKIEQEMRVLVMQVPYAEILLSIPGIGALSVAVFLGELGDPKYFPNYRSMVKFAGLDPVERESGLWTGGRRISKKGRFLLRKFIYYMSLRVVQHSAYFQEYYQRRLRTPNRLGQPLAKKEAVCVVSIKLIKVMFALLRDQRTFDEKPPVVLHQAA